MAFTSGAVSPVGESAGSEGYRPARTEIADSIGDRLRQMPRPVRHLPQFWRALPWKRLTRSLSYRQYTEMARTLLSGLLDPFGGRGRFS